MEQKKIEQGMEVCVRLRKISTGSMIQTNNNYPEFNASKAAGKSQ